VRSIWKTCLVKDSLDSISGLPRTDKENPDVKLKSTPLIGLVNLKNFVFDGKDEWSGERFTIRKMEKLINAISTLNQQTVLKIRGYIGVSLLGRNTFWTKSILTN